MPTRTGERPPVEHSRHGRRKPTISTFLAGRRQQQQDDDEDDDEGSQAGDAGFDDAQDAPPGSQATDNDGDYAMGDADAEGGSIQVQLGEPVEDDQPDQPEEQPEERDSGPPSPTASEIAGAEAQIHNLGKYLPVPGAAVLPFSYSASVPPLLTGHF